MRTLFKLIVAVVFLVGTLSVLAEKEQSDLPHNMMACDEVLKLSSMDFVKKYTKAHGENTIETVKAIYEYGACYDQAQDAIRDQLNQSGKGPFMGASGNFRDFETALNKFTQTALEQCSPDGTLKQVSDAYAMLYQKQFRHLFYMQYLQKKSSAKENTRAIESAKAKLDSLINHLSPQQAPKVRADFDAYYHSGVKVLGLPAQPVYEYAIMLLESPADKPFSAPPF